jgi:hypothetical protein
MQVCFYLIGQGFCHFIQTLGGFSLLLCQKTQGFIGSNPVEPGKKLTFLSKIFQTLPDLDQGILQNIIRVSVVYDHSADMPINFFLVFFDQLRKTLLPSNGIGKKG